MVESDGNDQPHEPEENPAMVAREREPDEKGVPQIDPVRVSCDAVADQLERPEGDFLEPRYCNP